MPTKMRDAGGILRAITRIRMRDAGGILRTIQQIRMRDGGGVLRTVFQYFSVALNSYTAYGTNSGGAASGSVTSSPTNNSTVTGGTGPYTYQWEFVAGNPGISATAPTGANTAFTATVPGIQSPFRATWRLRVTDAGGLITYSTPVSVELYWTDTR